MLEAVLFSGAKLAEEPFSCARPLGGGGDAAHAGARALELYTFGTPLNLMCCFMRVGEFGMARGRAQSTLPNL